MTNLVLFRSLQRICQGLGVDFYRVDNVTAENNAKTSDFSFKVIFLRLVKMSYLRGLVGLKISARRDRRSDWKIYS